MKQHDVAIFLDIPREGYIVVQEPPAGEVCNDLVAMILLTELGTIRRQVPSSILAKVCDIITRDADSVTATWTMQRMCEPNVKYVNVWPMKPEEITRPWQEVTQRRWPYMDRREHSRRRWTTTPWIYHNFLGVPQLS